MRRNRLTNPRGLSLSLHHDQNHSTGVVSTSVEKDIVLLAGLDVHLSDRQTTAPAHGWHVLIWAPTAACRLYRHTDEALSRKRSLSLRLVSSETRKPQEKNTSMMARLRCPSLLVRSISKASPTSSVEILWQVLWQMGRLQQVLFRSTSR